MPIVEVQRPDGGIDELDLPDETSPETIQATVKRHVASFQQPRPEARVSQMSPEERRAAYMRAGTEAMAQGEGVDFTGGLGVKPQPSLVRAAIPAYSAILTGGASIPAQMAIGALGSMAGEVGGQIAEAQNGEPTKFKLGQIAGAGIAGAAPVAPARAAMATFKTMGSQALGAGLGSAAEQAIDKGDVSTGEAAVRAGFGGALGGIPAVVGGGAEIVRNKLLPAIGRAASVEQIAPKAKATIEQLFPGRAPMARRIVSRTSETGRELRQLLESQGEEIRNTIGNIVGGGPVDNPNVVSKKLIEGLGESPELARDIRNANEQLGSLADAIQTAKDAAKRARLQVEFDTLRTEAQGKVAQALGIQNIGEFQKVASGIQVGKGIEDARDAFYAHGEQLYGQVNKIADERLFDAAPLVDDARELIAKIPALKGLGNISKLLQSASDEAKAFSGNAPTASSIVDQFGNPIMPFQQTVFSPSYKASLNELRGIAGEMFDLANDPNVAVGKNSGRLLKEFAGKIRRTIEDQAESAIGANLAPQLMAGNAFWAKYRPRFSELGIREAFMREGEKMPKLAAQIAEDVMSEGAITSKYNNVVSLFRDMAKDGVPNVPTTAELNTAMREAVVAKARDEATGAIDFEQLATVIRKMEVQSPGTASKIGFGSIKELQEFAKRVGPLRDAISGGDVAKITRLIEEGNTAAMWHGSGAVSIRRILSLENREAIMDALREMTRSGTPESKTAAANAIRSAQMSFLNETFDLTSQGQMNPSAALREWNVAVKNGTAKTILGESGVNAVNNTIVPGLKTIQDAFVETKNVGAWASQLGPTEAARAGRSAMSESLKGNIGNAGAGIVSSALTELGYNTIARVIVRGAGVSGLRSKAATMRVISKLASMPKAAAMQAAYRYAETGEEPR